VHYSTCAMAQDTRTPLNAEAMTRVFETIREGGVLVGKGGMYGNTLRIKPPMCIDKADVDMALDVIDRALCAR